MKKKYIGFIAIQLLTISISVTACLSIFWYENYRFREPTKEKSISFQEYGIIVSSDKEIELSTFNNGDVRVKSAGNILMYASGVFCCSIKFDGIYNAHGDRVVSFDY